MASVSMVTFQKWYLCSQLVDKQHMLHPLVSPLRANRRRVYGWGKSVPSLIFRVFNVSVEPPSHMYYYRRISTTFLFPIIFFSLYDQHRRSVSPVSLRLQLISRGLFMSRNQRFRQGAPRRRPAVVVVSLNTLAAGQDEGKPALLILLYPPRRDLSSTK